MTAIKDKPEIEYSEWSPEDEIQLFFAMDGLRPIGINRHFTVACIVERLSKALNRDVSSESIWSHLKTMYNLKALEDQEQQSYLNEESEFSLPEADFSAVMKRKSIEEPVLEDVKKLESKAAEPATKIAKEKETSDKEKSVDKDAKSTKPTKIDHQDNTPKRPQKRTRGSMSLEPNGSSPASTPPNVQSSKRRRI